LESRIERHRKNKKEPKRQRFTKKHFLLLSAAAIVCFTVGVGISMIQPKVSTLQAIDSDHTAPAATSNVIPSSKPVQTSAPPSATPANASSTPSSSSTPSAAPPGSPVKLAFVGDVLLASKVESEMLKYGYDYPYSAVKDYLQQADYTLANLETPVTERGQAQQKEYAYRSSPLALPALASSGIDLVNLANNHVMDYGTEGLLDTFKALDNAGVKRIGAGKDAEEAYKPVIVEKQGMKIAFLGFSRVVPEQSWKASKVHPGVAETYDYRVAVDAIQKAKEQADLVVVIAHWGVERDDYPDKYQKELSHRYIDAGADLIVASHPHVLQGFENYKGKWIAYSLGNFIFTQNENPKTWDSLILEATCTKEKKCDLHAVPVLTKLAKPELMAAEQGAKLLEHLTKISIGARVDANGQIHTIKP
jgi:poly-gamma-glutamate capsule biosynthesis protein CapA/YwtB (metallophosphatase superfamily)